MTEKMTINTTNVEKFEGWELADELGILQEQIGRLKEREAELKGELIDRGYDVDGNYFSVKLVPVDRTTTNWRLIANKLGASRQIITAHSRRTSYAQVRVTELEG